MKRSGSFEEREHYAKAGSRAAVLRRGLNLVQPHLVSNEVANVLLDPASTCTWETKAAREKRQRLSAGMAEIRRVIEQWLLSLL